MVAWEGSDAIKRAGGPSSAREQECEWLGQQRKQKGGDCTRLQRRHKIAATLEGVRVPWSAEREAPAPGLGLSGGWSACEPALGTAAVVPVLVGVEWSRDTDERPSEKDDGK